MECTQHVCRKNSDTHIYIYILFLFSYKLVYHSAFATSSVQKRIEKIKQNKTLTVQRNSFGYKQKRYIHSIIIVREVQHLYLNHIIENILLAVMVAAKAMHHLDRSMVIRPKVHHKAHTKDATQIIQKRQPCIRKQLQQLV